MFDPGPCVYMEKIAVGPMRQGAIDITASPTENLQAVAKAKGESVRDLTVVILDRDRHRDLIAEVREAGARVRLISDGDVYGAIATAWPDAGVDVLFGIGGTPEGVIAAAALKCMGGELQGRLWPRDEDERAAAVAAGYDLDRVLTTDDLVQGDNCFFAATGITDGELLRGVRFDPQEARHAVARDALALGHGAPRRRPPPPRQAPAVRVGRLRLMPAGASRRRRRRTAMAVLEAMEAPRAGRRRRPASRSGPSLSIFPAVLAFAALLGWLELLHRRGRRRGACARQVIEFVDEHARHHRRRRSPRPSSTSCPQPRGGVAVVGLPHRGLEHVEGVRRPVPRPGPHRRPAGRAQQHQGPRSSPSPSASARWLVMLVLLLSIVVGPLLGFEKLLPNDGGVLITIWSVRPLAVHCRRRGRRGSPCCCSVGPGTGVRWRRAPTRRRCSRRRRGCVVTFGFELYFRFTGGGNPVSACSAASSSPYLALPPGHRPCSWPEC